MSSLIEIIIAISIMMILIFGVSAMLSNIFLRSSHDLATLNNIDQARVVLSAFTNEIRNALAGSDGSYALNHAGEHEIIFYSNYKTENGAIARIRYYVLENDLYKGVVLPSGSPLSYNLASESIRKIFAGVSDGASPSFYYYGGDYGGESEEFLEQPVNINDVRFAKMSLLVEGSVIESGATIRSLKNNLGD